MTRVQPVRGTRDVIGEAYARHQHIIGRAWQLAKNWGFEGIETPVFEFTDVFARSLGATSDIVAKEMYQCTDRGGESLTLRPEGTAGIVRALLSNSLDQTLPRKFFYAGPMFRYERPQKGRQRQFTQIGVELMGSDHPSADLDCLLLAQALLDELDLKAKTRLELNSLGDSETRARYRDSLVTYFETYRADLSEDSQRRLPQNPLRIFDSKIEGDRRLCLDAPKITDYLSPLSRGFFDVLCLGLSDLGIVFHLNPHLVRGLDYYTHTIFEWTSTALGAQGTVLAGGRYNDLVQEFGGPAIACVGWAAGIERLALLTSEVPLLRPIKVMIITIGSVPENEGLRLAHSLRSQGVCVDLPYGGTLKKKMKLADRAAVDYVVLLGEDELARGQVALKNLKTGMQSFIRQEDIRGSLR